MKFILTFLFMSFLSVAVMAAERMTCTSGDLTVHIPDIHSFLNTYDERGDVQSVLEFNNQTFEVTLKEGYFLDLSQWSMASRFLVVPKLFRKEVGPVTKIDFEVLVFDDNHYRGQGRIKFRYQKKTHRHELSCFIE